MAAAGTADAINLESWDNQINKPSRFKVLSAFGDAAVLDKETQLVWEQSPDRNTRTWLGAQVFCNNRNVGNRLGWRLPTIQELASLIDPTIASPDPTLPLGHPFRNVLSSHYWSATTFASDAIFAWDVDLFNGVVGSRGKIDAVLVWGVRGGPGVDPQ